MNPYRVGPPEAPPEPPPDESALPIALTMLVAMLGATCMSPRWLMLSAVVVLGSFAMFAMFCFGQTLGSRKQHREWVKAQERAGWQANRDVVLSGHGLEEAQQSLQPQASPTVAQ